MFVLAHTVSELTALIPFPPSQNAASALRFGEDISANKDELAIILQGIIINTNI